MADRYCVHKSSRVRCIRALGIQLIVVAENVIQTMQIGTPLDKLGQT